MKQPLLHFFRLAIDLEWRDSEIFDAGTLSARGASSPHLGRLSGYPFHGWLDSREYRQADGLLARILAPVLRGETSDSGGTEPGERFIPRGHAVIMAGSSS